MENVRRAVQSTSRTFTERKELLGEYSEEESNRFNQRENSEEIIVDILIKY